MKLIRSSQTLDVVVQSKLKENARNVLYLTGTLVPLLFILAIRGSQLFSLQPDGLH